METDLLSKILVGMEVDLSKSIYNLQPVAFQILAWFWAYELIIGMLHSESGSNPLLILKNKITTWAYLYAIIYFYQDLLKLINEMFTYFCEVAIGGGSVPKLTEIPSNTLQVGAEAVSKLWDYAKLTQPSTWLLVIGMAFGLFIFAKISLTIGMIVIEYLVLTSLVIILIPFMMFKKMEFVGNKVLGMIINLNMKILMIRFLIFYFSKFLTEPLPINDSMKGMEIVEQSFYWLVAMACLGMMTMQGHTIAQALISGVTSFGDSSELVSTVREGVKGAKNQFMKNAGRISGAIKGGLAGSKQSSESGSGGISGAVNGVKAGLKEARSSGSNHKASYGIGGAVGGGFRGLKNTFGKNNKGE